MNAPDFDLSAIPSDPETGPDSADAGSAHRRLRRPEPHPMVLNIVSMIDVIFLLMTYFLLTAKFTTQEESFEVRTPGRLESTAADPVPADPFALPATAVVLTVTSRGDGPTDFTVFTDAPALTSGGPMTNYEDIKSRATGARGGVFADDQRFVIRPVADARWEHTLGVLNAVKRAGYNNVRFANPARAGG